LSKKGSTTTRVAAVLAAYNRRDLTLACLRSLRAQQIPDVALDVFVLDEASGDGTSEAIAEQFPEVTVLHGNGSCTGAADAARLRRRHRRRLRAVRGYVQEPTKETVPIPELIKDPNDAAPRGEKVIQCSLP
jgi:Glycosyl transferase family 2